jgi:curli biogenesis system outer membrane secretion channel CsgG
MITPRLPGIGDARPITPLARFGRVGLVLAAISGLAACTTSAAEPASADRAAAAAPPTQGFVRRPVQHLLFTAKPSASPAEVEAYFKANLLPALAADARIGDVATYVDKTGTYIVEAELRTMSPGSASLALDVLGIGRTPAQAQALIDGFARFFDVANTQQLFPRADLSVSRRILGTVTGGTP